MISDIKEILFIIKDEDEISINTDRNFAEGDNIQDIYSFRIQLHTHLMRKNHKAGKVVTNITNSQAMYEFMDRIEEICSKYGYTAHMDGNEHYQDVFIVKSSLDFLPKEAFAKLNEYPHRSGNIQVLDDQSIKIRIDRVSPSGPVEHHVEYDFQIKWDKSNFRILSATKGGITYKPGDRVIIVEDGVPSEWLRCDEGKSYPIRVFKWEGVYLSVNFGSGTDKWWTHFRNKYRMIGDEYWKVDEIRFPT